VAAGRVEYCHQSTNQVTSASLYNIPTVINGQVLSTGKSVPTNKKAEQVVKSNVINNQHKDHKVLLLSDSHGRGCEERIKNQLPSNFEVCGLVKPGASSSILSKIVSTEINKFMRKDFTVLWYGLKDISSNRATSGVRNIYSLL
jgi:hypothetical protein